jgi:hypothetical protein
MDTNNNSAPRPLRLLKLMLLTTVLFGSAGCQTFSGMSSEERDRANQDKASENRFLPAFKPDRDIHDQNWVP